jgi:hypothetical protein
MVRNIWLTCCQGTHRAQTRMDWTRPRSREPILQSRAAVLKFYNKRDVGGIADHMCPNAGSSELSAGCVPLSAQFLRWQSRTVSSLSMVPGD